MKTKISTFLKERQDRFKPGEANKLGLRRIEKITQEGEIFLSDKPSNTNMILVKPGDLVLSGIGIAKGGGNSLNVYEGKEDVLATIHYSSYIINENLISKEFLKIFLISHYFRKLLQENSPNGIKAEIKPKHFLPIELELPSLEQQKKILQKINSVQNEIKQLGENVSDDELLLSKLRQAILSEAVQGKLVPQNPKDKPASELLKNIKNEKENLIKEGKIKKRKELPPINKDEVPYELPKGWVWCRLGEVLEFAENFDVQKNLDKTELVNYVDIDAIDNNKHKIREVKLLPVHKLSTRARRILKKDYIVYSLVRPYLDNIAIIPDNKKNYIGSTGFAVFKPISVLKEYLFYFLLNPFLRDYYLKLLTGFNSPNIGFSKFSETPFPLPPLSEQKRIVEKVDALMKFCGELELRIKENKENSENLMGAVLREVFENGK